MGDPHNVRLSQRRGTSVRNAIIAVPPAFPIAHIVSNEVVAGNGVPDGVFLDAEDRLVFALHPVPTSGDVLASLYRIVRRVARRLAHVAITTRRASCCIDARRRRNSTAWSASGGGGSAGSRV
jgi:hypothetical protein